jgi:hypothetical protein
MAKKTTEEKAKFEGETVKLDVAWEEVDPRDLLPTVHLGELKLGEGEEQRIWGILKDWSGSNLIVHTDLLVDPPVAGGLSQRRFILNGAMAVRQLAESLIK